jgi:hypothetical protein
MTGKKYERREVEEDKRAKFLKIYANVPENLRGDIIAVVDRKPYTWNTSFLEIKENTELGKKILKLLIKMGIL